MDTAQWPQEIVVKPIEGNNTIAKQSTSLERKAITTQRPHRKDQALNCPRCNSTNTKFCYYNNYSLTQPRYFCKTCKRYWTEGGSLRNIPVGGGSNKKHKNVMIRSDPISSSSNLKKFPDPPSTNNTFSHQYDIQNPNTKICTQQQQQQGQDRNLSFTSQLVQVHQGLVTSNDHQTSNKTQLLGLELLTGFSNATTGLNLNSNFMAMDGPTISSVYNNATSATGFNINNTSSTNNQIMHGHGHSDDDLKPAATLSFSLDGFGGGIGFSNLQESGNSGGRLLFPFDNLLHQQHVSSDQQNNKDHNNSNGDPSSSVYWSGMLGDGSW
ncbi:hypothetical protein ACFE04_005084 [Oxalis oulophora]